MTRHSMFKAILAGGAGALAIAAATASAAQTRTFDIPPGDLNAALATYIRQSGVQLIYRADDVRGMTTAGVRGSMSAEVALDQLLAGTSVRVVRDSTGAVVLTSEATRPLDRLAAASADATVVEDVIVTGSRIRVPGGSAGSNLQVLTRDDLDRSGYGNIQDVLKTLPMVWQGGPSEDVRGGTGDANTFFGAGVDLRGLGTQSTLTLLNGRRLPVAGGATFVDISNIPASAIKRVEILPDGASAIYGSDAVSGVVNIILRDDFTSAESRVRYGAATSGQLNEYQIGQSLGRGWDGGHAMLSLEYYKRANLPNAERRYTASSDLRPLGGEDFRWNFTNPGNIMGLSPQGLFVPRYGIPSGQDGTNLTIDQLLPTLNLGNSNEDRDALPRQERWSAFGTVTQKIGDTSLFLEGRYTDREYNYRVGGYIGVLVVPPSNPFFLNASGIGVDIINYNFGHDLGIAEFTGNVESYGMGTGFETPLWGDWQLKGYGSYNQDNSTFYQTNSTDSTALNVALADPNPATAFNPYGDHAANNPATIESFRQNHLVGLDSRLWSASLTADGSLFRIPGGDVKMAVGSDYREERFHVTSSVGDPRDPINRSVGAAFVEFYAPLVGADNRRPGIERLNLSLAARHDRYGGDIDTSTTNPKIGLLWTPVKGLNLRSSYGTSFRAPSMGQLDVSRNGMGTFNFPDPKSPTGTTLAPYLNGNNADLKNETSDQWTFGFDAEPSFLPGLKFGAGYFNIEYVNRITRPPLIADILVEEEHYGSIFIRNPTQQQIDEFCERPAVGITNVPACKATPWGALIDARLNNSARTYVKGFDFNASYALKTERFHNFNFMLSGTKFLEYDEQFSSTASRVSTINRVQFPVDLRVTGGVSWNNDRGLAVSAIGNYTPGYKDRVSQPNRDIDSLLTFDLNIGWDLSRLGPKWEGLKANFNVVNLFNTDPPFVNNAIGVAYDPANADPIGRFASLTLTKAW